MRDASERTDRLIEIEAALSQALRALEARRAGRSGRAGKARTDTAVATTPSRAPAPQPQQTPPEGMKWLVPPRHALTAHQGDARLVEIVFARWLFTRAVAARRAPTQQSLAALYPLLRGLALRQLARVRLRRGEPLPLREGAPALPRALRASESPQTTLRAMRAARAVGGTGGGTGGGASGDGNPLDSQDAQDALIENNPEIAPDAVDYEAVDPAILDELSWWDQWGDATDAPASEYVEASQLPVSPEDMAAIGSTLTFEDVITALTDSGLTDLQAAQALDAAWNGQASLWAGQTTFDAAGLAGTFDIVDPWFLDYLRNQSGYWITGIDEYTRRSVSETLWSMLGGNTDLWGGTKSVDSIASWLRTVANAYQDTNLTGMSAARAYMIAATETARAESFGTFVSLWQTGARQKIWIATAGACIYCVTNVEEGPVSLTAEFPTGMLAPPQHPLCFVAGTPILTDAGEIPIERIDIGMRVWTHEARWQPVMALMRRLYSGDLVTLTVADGRTVEATANHPVRVRRDDPQKPYEEWVAVGDLAPDDKALAWVEAAHAFTPLAQQTMRRRVREMLVYNFEVARDHSYTAAGISVKNCRCSIAAYVPDTFNPEDWRPRPASDLTSMLSSWNGAGWPAAGSLPDSLNDYALADMAQTTRRRAPNHTHAAVRPRVVKPHPLAWHAFAAFGSALAGPLDAAARAWAQETGVAYPRDVEAIQALARRLPTLPAERLRAADRAYLRRVNVATSRALATIHRDTAESKE